RLRWEIEISIKTLKSLLKVENITGYSKIAVQQDYLSKILSYNLINDIKITSQKIKDHNDQNSRYRKKKKGKINTNLAIGFFKLEIIDIFIENNQEKQTKMLTLLSVKISKYYTNTSTKQYERPDKTPPRKNRTNCRRSF
ncbi:hypothetical protein, partial [Methanobrevibacter filiformis]|uniref:hypothetical protein n=1 Tax=Methanobrevibacter filiformis TaxID=55758 RepID=UPI000A75E475